MPLLIEKLPPAEESEDTITEDMYSQMCEDIRQDQGELSRIVFIGYLKRKDSDLTLWKVNYTPSEDDVSGVLALTAKHLKLKMFMLTGKCITRTSKPTSGNSHLFYKEAQKMRQSPPAVVVGVNDRLREVCLFASIPNLDCFVEKTPFKKNLNNDDLTIYNTN